MKIDANQKAGIVDNYIKSVGPASSKQKEAISDSEKAKDLSDKVEISQRGLDTAKIIERVKAIPEVRQDKVESIKQALDSGKYKINAEKVAKGILKGTILDEIF